MTPSTRKPSKKQHQVLDAIRLLQHELRVDEPVSFSTPQILQMVRDIHHDDATLVNVLNALTACRRHEWLTVRQIAPNSERKQNGDNLGWAITPAGREAFARAEGSGDDQQEEAVGTTTQDPPKGTTHPGADDPIEPDAEALGELDEEEVECELEEPEDDNPSVNEGATQLTLAIGGPKPKSSILKIMSKQQKFGTTRQFKNMERIPFSGVLEVRGVAVDVQANGFVQRLQKAVIAELVIDGTDVSDNDE